jgi:hypothetical protein
MRCRTSRPAAVKCSRASRTLRPGGTYFARHVGAGTVRELTDFMMGPQTVSVSRSPRQAREEAEAAGLDLLDLTAESSGMEFYDVAAVIDFLRTVIWIVPGFAVDAYRERLAALHELIGREAKFTATPEWCLIEARKPD